MCQKKNIWGKNINEATGASGPPQRHSAPSPACSPIPSNHFPTRSQPPIAALPSPSVTQKTPTHSLQKYPLLAVATAVGAAGASWQSPPAWQGAAGSSPSRLAPVLSLSDQADAAQLGRAPHTVRELRAAGAERHWAPSVSWSRPKIPDSAWCLAVHHGALPSRETPA